jgi:hypothetical protein
VHSAPRISSARDSLESWGQNLEGMGQKLHQYFFWAHEKLLGARSYTSISSGPHQYFFWAHEKLLESWGQNPTSISSGPHQYFFWAPPVFLLGSREASWATRVGQPGPRVARAPGSQQETRASSEASARISSRSRPVDVLVTAEDSSRKAREAGHQQCLCSSKKSRAPCRGPGCLQVFSG